MSLEPDNEPMADPKPSPRVSVIIPSHNRAHTIADSIRSVLDQSFTDFEIIVVDDASSDDTVNIVNAVKDPRLRLIRHDFNAGACAARNTGIEAARADYIAFQDSDDEWQPDKLARQMRLFDEHPGAPFIAYCGFVRIAGNQTIEVPAKRNRHRSGTMIPTLLHRNLVSTQTLVAPRQCLLAVNGFDPELPRLQDWDLAIRLAQQFAFRIVDRPLVTVHTTTGSITNDRRAFLAACRILIHKHAALYAQYPDAQIRMRLRIAAAAIRLRKPGIAAEQARHILRMGLTVIPAIATLSIDKFRDMQS